MKHKIGILGAGTWGMALARMLTVSGNDVTVWSALFSVILLIFSKQSPLVFYLGSIDTPPDVIRASCLL